MSIITQSFQYVLSTLTSFYIRSLLKRLNKEIFATTIKNLSYFQFRTKRDSRYYCEQNEMKHIRLSLHDNVIIDGIIFMHYKLRYASYGF